MLGRSFLQPNKFFTVSRKIQDKLIVPYTEVSKLQNLILSNQRREANSFFQDLIKNYEPATHLFTPTIPALIRKNNNELLESVIKVMEQNGIETSREIQGDLLEHFAQYDKEKFFSILETKKEKHRAKTLQAIIIIFCNNEDLPSLHKFLSIIEKNGDPLPRAIFEEAIFRIGSPTHTADYEKSRKGTIVLLNYFNETFGTTFYIFKKLIIRILNNTTRCQLAFEIFKLAIEKHKIDKREFEKKGIAIKIVKTAIEMMTTKKKVSFTRM